MATKGKQKAWRLAALQFNVVRKHLGQGPTARQVKAEASVIGARHRQELAWQSGEQGPKFVPSGYCGQTARREGSVKFGGDWMSIIAAEATALGESIDHDA